MRKGAALFLTASLVFVIIGNYFFFSNETGSFESVIVTRAIDGDTLELEDGRTVRLVNVNTPEKKERGYAEARAFLARLENKTVQLDARGIEKYGRTLGAVYLGKEYVNLELIRQGYAHTLLVDEKEVARFEAAQQEAFENGRGVWERSPSYGCIQAEIDKKEEYVDFSSACGLTMGWTIQDETTHGYAINFEMPSSFRLYSAKGTDSENAYYWGRGNVWNNDRDTLFVRDSNRLIVLVMRYGY